MIYASPGNRTAYAARLGAALIVVLGSGACGKSTPTPGSGEAQSGAIAPTQTTQPLVAKNTAQHRQGSTRQMARRSPIARALAVLRQRGIDTSGGVTVSSGVVRFTYETSAATAYDDELLLVWATAFGVLGGLAEREVIIVNTVAGRPVMEVSARSRAIAAMVGGELSSRAFLRELRITSVGPEQAAERDGGLFNILPEADARRSGSRIPTRTKPANNPQNQGIRMHSTTRQRAKMPSSRRATRGTQRAGPRARPRRVSRPRRRPAQRPSRP